MAKLNFNKLNLKLKKDIVEIPFGESTIEVKQYLPQADKVSLIEFVIASSIDDATGCFSPIRIETFLAIGIIKFYTNIVFTEKQLSEISKTYDLLESNGVIALIHENIPDAELQFIITSTYETAEDIARYNNSFAGIINMISDNTGSMDEQFNEIIEKIKNKEGLEVLAAIQDVVG